MNLQARTTDYKIANFSGILQDWKCIFFFLLILGLGRPRIARNYTV